MNFNIFTLTLNSEQTVFNKGLERQQIVLILLHIVSHLVVARFLFLFITVGLNSPNQSLRARLRFKNVTQPEWKLFE